MLADALALADEERPDAVISFATLTGAARVALGPDLPPLYYRRRRPGAGDRRRRQPRRRSRWRMPFWSAYEANLDSPVADMNNVSEVAVRRLRDGGAVPAPLRQAGRALTPTSTSTAGGQAPKPLGPKGGEPQAARAIFEVLRRGMR